MNHIYDAQWIKAKRNGRLRATEFCRAFTADREIGRADEIGSIEQGKLADFVVCKEDLSPQSVYIGGKRVRD